MSYRSFSFPPETPLFPVASVVHKYLEDYATHFGLLRYVRFNTQRGVGFLESRFEGMGSHPFDGRETSI